LVTGPPLELSMGSAAVIEVSVVASKLAVARKEGILKSKKSGWAKDTLVKNDWTAAESVPKQ